MARILILERDSSLRFLLEAVCGALGHEPVSRADAADDGADTSFDLAIVEPATPRAIAFVETLRREQPQIPVVFYAMQAASALTRRLEPNAYLVKPVPVAALATAIREALI